jgi:hypothetical protein
MQHELEAAHDKEVAMQLELDRIAELLEERNSEAATITKEKNNAQIELEEACEEFRLAELVWEETRGGLDHQLEQSRLKFEHAMESKVMLDAALSDLRAEKVNKDIEISELRAENKAAVSGQRRQSNQSFIDLLDKKDEQIAAFLGQKGGMEARLTHQIEETAEWREKVSALQTELQDHRATEKSYDEEWTNMEKQMGEALERFNTEAEARLQLETHVIEIKRAHTLDLEAAQQAAMVQQGAFEEGKAASVALAADIIELKRVHELEMEQAQKRMEEQHDELEGAQRDFAHFAATVQQENTETGEAARLQLVTDLIELKRVRKQELAEAQQASEAGEAQQILLETELIELRAQQGKLEEAYRGVSEDGKATHMELEADVTALHHFLEQAQRSGAEQEAVIEAKEANIMELKRAHEVQLEQARHAAVVQIGASEAGEAARAELEADFIRQEFESEMVKQELNAKLVELKRVHDEAIERMQQSAVVQRDELEEAQRDFAHFAAAVQQENTETGEAARLQLVTDLMELKQAHKQQLEEMHTAADELSEVTPRKCLLRNIIIFTERHENCDTDTQKLITTQATRAEMENLRFANDGLLEQHEEDSLELQSLGKERDGLTQELQLVTTAQVDQVDQMMQTQVDQLTVERDDLIASAACFEEKFETHRRLMEQAQKEACRMQEEEAQWEAKVAEQNVQIKNLLETNSDVELKYEELKDTNDGMIEEAATAHDQIKQLEAKIIRNAESIQQLTKENGGLRYTPHKGVSDSKEMYELEETLAVEKSESARLKHLHDQRVGELTQVKKRFESSQVKLVRLASELLQSQGEAKVHRDASLGLTTEKQALQAKLDQHQAAAKRTLERSSTLQRNLSASEGALKVTPSFRSFFSPSSSSTPSTSRSSSPSSSSSL